MKAESSPVCVCVCVCVCAVNCLQTRCLFKLFTITLFNISSLVCSSCLCLKNCSDVLQENRTCVYQVYMKRTIISWVHLKTPQTESWFSAGTGALQAVEELMKCSERASERAILESTIMYSLSAAVQTFTVFWFLFFHERFYLINSDFLILKWRISIKVSEFKSRIVFSLLFVSCSWPRFWSGSFICESGQFIDEETRHQQTTLWRQCQSWVRQNTNTVQSSLWFWSLSLHVLQLVSDVSQFRLWGRICLCPLSTASRVRAVSQEDLRLKFLGSVPSERPPEQTDGRQQPSDSERVSGPSPSCRHVVSTEPDRPELPPEYWGSDRTGNGTRPRRTDPDPSGPTPIQHQAETPGGTAPGLKEPSGEPSQEDGKRLQSERQSRL